MPRHSSEKTERLVGQAALREILQLLVPAPAVTSCLVGEARRTEVRGHRIIEYYPRYHKLDGTPISHLRFAFQHEAADMGVLVAALRAIDGKEIETWVRREPTSAYARRAWFLYETFTGRELDLEVKTNARYVEALDPRRHVVGRPWRSIRHRVLNNLLGGPDFCPVVRWTERLRARAQSRFDLEMRAIVEAGGTQARTLAQNHIHADEAQSALALEGHPLSAPRFERFVASLKAAALFDMTNQAGLLQLQGAVADPRFAGAGWRKDQAFLGSLPAGSGGAVNLICPRPQDLPSLMGGWMTLARRLQVDGVDPVVAAALSSFSFLFLRPFQDGNERMHSLIMHHMLIRRGFNPSSMVLPLSSVILGDRRGYAEAVESFGYPLFNYIEWRWAPGRQIVVTNDTADLYRYFDATALAEYLYDRVADAVRIDLPQTLDFTVMFDRAFAAMQEIVDMPERRAELFLRSCLRNGGRLAWDRSKFPELHDREVAALEALVQGASGATRPASGARRKAAAKAGHRRLATAESRVMRRNVMAAS